MPRRLRMRRTKGWRKPAGARYVGRPTKWGNPWHPSLGNARDAHDAVAKYRAWAAGDFTLATEVGRRFPAECLPELRGHDLVCWCDEGEPCHADTLLALANQDERRSDTSEGRP